MKVARQKCASRFLGTSVAISLSMNFQRNERKRPRQTQGLKPRICLSQNFEFQNDFELQMAMLVIA